MKKRLTFIFSLAKYFTISNMKRVGRILFSLVTLLSGLVTILGGVAVVSTWSSDPIPTLELYYNGKDIQNGDQRNVVICLDDTTNNNSLEELFPIFRNTTSHSAKDFAMIYEIKLDSIEIEPKEDEFTLSYDGDNRYILKYKENIVPAHFYVKEPVRNIKMLGEKARLLMEARATYEGVPDIYRYIAEARFYYVNSVDKNYKEWKDACLSLIANKANISQLDILYASNKFMKEYEFDRIITYNPVSPSLNHQLDNQIKGNVEQTNQREEELFYDNRVVQERYFGDAIVISSYVIKKNKDGADTLSMVVKNGFNNDTTVIAEVQSQNISSNEIEIEKTELLLLQGDNKVSIPIKNHNRYIDCTFKNPQQNDTVNNNQDDISLLIIAIIFILIGVLLCYWGARLIRGRKKIKE